MPPTPTPKLPSPEPGFSHIDALTALARAKYTAHPPPLPKIPIPAPQAPTQKDKDFDSRLSLALARSDALMAQARNQLAAPIRAPDELTGPELLERAYGDIWDEGYAAASAYNEHLSCGNQALFEDVMGSIDECIVEDAEGAVIVPEDLSVPDEDAELVVVESVPEDVTSWVRESRERLREQTRRQAARKPVMVLRPAVVPSVQVQQTNGVASFPTRLESQIRNGAGGGKKRGFVGRKTAKRTDWEMNQGKKKGKGRKKEGSPESDEVIRVEKDVFTQKPAWFPLAKWDFIVSW